MSKTLTELEKKMRQELHAYAFWRWENAVIIGGTLLLVFFFPQPFAGWPLWGWPVIGALTLAAMVASTLTDTALREKIRRSLLHEHYDLLAIRSGVLRGEVEKALTAQARMHVYIQKVQDVTLRPTLDQVLEQVVKWTRAAYELALRLDAYQHDPLWEQERRTLPQEMETLRARLKYENNPEVKTQLDNVIQSKQKQWETFKMLDERIKQAELHLGRSNAHLEVLETQMQTLTPHEVQQGSARRLQQGIKEQLSNLNSLITSIDEIYAYRSSGA